jgi:hypothetical protein
MEAKEDEIKLSNGKTATIKQGKGKDALKAQKLCAGDSDKYLQILMSLLVKIDGQNITLEDLEDLPLNDFSKVQVKFSEINFT